MRRALASALTSGLCCVILVACSNDGATGPVESSNRSTGPATSTPTTPATATATTSSDPAGVTEPVMPALAREKSTAGAKAFVKYYINVYNYAFLASDSERLARISVSACTICRRLVRIVDNNKRRGGYQIGGEWLPRRLSVVPSQPKYAPIVIGALRITSGYYKASASDRHHTITAENALHEFRLRWTSGGWQLTDLRNI